MIQTLSKIWSFALNRRAELLRALMFAFLRSAFAAFQLYAVACTIDALTGQANVQKTAIIAAICALICVVGTYLTSYHEQTATMRAGFFMTADKRISLGKLLRRLPLGFFSVSSTGRVAATLTTTLSGVETASVMTMVGVISGLFNALVLLVFVLFFDVRIGLLAGAGTIAYLLVVAWQIRVSRKNAPSLQTALTRLANAALTFFQGIKVTKAFSVQNGDRELKSAIEGSRSANLLLTNLSMPSQFAAAIVVAIFESAILLFAVVGNYDAGNTVLLMVFSFMVYGALSQAGSMLSMIGMLDSAISEVEDIECVSPLETFAPQQHPDDNEIVFDHVSFAYGENEVLHDVSFRIPQHSLTALVGPSGSGKTTLCQLIPRFHDATKGKITIGGADIRSIPEEELMRRVSMVFQRVYLFEDTIANNIRFGKPDAADAEVIAAAKAARCHDFIAKLPNGYDTPVGEGGCTLSGGEKQRISIARAMLKDAPIIILDEATSALDAENEQEIIAAIDELTKNKTVIMIAHRMKTVRNADNIIVLKDGKIAQQGRHETLLQQQGIYADFVHAREKAAGWQIRN